MLCFHSDRRNANGSLTCLLADPPHTHTPPTPPLSCLSSLNCFHKAGPTGRKRNVRLEKKSRRGDEREKDQVWIKEIGLSVWLKSSDSQRQRIWEGNGRKTTKWLQLNKKKSRCRNEHITWWMANWTTANGLVCCMKSHVANGFFHTFVSFFDADQLLWI